MKKLIYGAAVALLLGAASCGKSDGNADSAKFFSETAQDSLLSSFGKLVGSSLNAEISQNMERDSTLSKQVFLRGLQTALAADTSDSYINGYIYGIRIQQQLKAYRRMGLDVEAKDVLDAVKKAFLSDSVPTSIDLQMMQGTYTMWNDSLYKAQAAYAAEVKNNSEESLANIEKGKKFIAERVAADDSVKTTASGMAYKIISAGDAQKLTADDRPIIKAVGKTADGRVIEQYDRRTTRMGGTIPGMQEGLLMLGKGGKAVFYIPGELAYGVDAPERLGIGLNELVIYEVEVVDLAQSNQVQPGMPQGMPQGMQPRRR